MWTVLRLDRDPVASVDSPQDVKEMSSVRKQARNRWDGPTACSDPSSAYSQPECFETEDNLSESLAVRLWAITQGKRRLKPEASSCAGDLCTRKLLRGLQRDNVRKSTSTEGERRLKESVRNEG